MAIPTACAASRSRFSRLVVAVCDVYEAMVSARAYRRGRPGAEALAELQRCAGTHFDRAVVEAFLAMRRERGLIAGYQTSPSRQSQVSVPERSRATATGST